MIVYLPQEPSIWKGTIVQTVHAYSYRTDKQCCSSVVTKHNTPYGSDKEMITDGYICLSLFEDPPCAVYGFTSPKVCYVITEYFAITKLLILSPCAPPPL